MSVFEASGLIFLVALVVFLFLALVLYPTPIVERLATWSLVTMVGSSPVLVISFLVAVL